MGLECSESTALPKQATLQCAIPFSGSINKRSFSAKDCKQPGHFPFTLCHCARLEGDGEDGNNVGEAEVVANESVGVVTLVA